MLKYKVLCDLCDINDMKNLVMGPMCFKGETPTLLDVCQSINIDTGRSDFHKLTGIVSRAYAPKSPKRMIKYRSMKKFKTEEYMRDMNLVPFHVCDIFDDVDDIVWAHGQFVTSVIDFHAPLIFLIWTWHFERSSTRGTCGTGISGISGILSPEKNMCIGETRWWNYQKPL